MVRSLKISQILETEGSYLAAAITRRVTKAPQTSFLAEAMEPNLWLSVLAISHSTAADKAVLIFTLLPLKLAVILMESGATVLHDICQYQ